MGVSFTCWYAYLCFPRGQDMQLSVRGVAGYTARPVYTEARVRSSCLTLMCLWALYCRTRTIATAAAHLLRCWAAGRSGRPAAVVPPCRTACRHARVNRGGGQAAGAGAACLSRALCLSSSSRSGCLLRLRAAVAARSLIGPRAGAWYWCRGQRCSSEGGSGGGSARSTQGSGSGGRGVLGAVGREPVRL